MKLLNNKLEHDSEFISELDNINVSLDNSILNISFNLIDSSNKTIPNNVQVDIKNFKGGFVDIVSMSLEEPNSIFVIPSYTSFSYANRLRKQVLSSTDKRLFTIMVNDDGTDCDILICPLVSSANLPIIRPKESSTYSKIFTSLSDIGSTNFERYKSKSLLLGNVYIEDSVAYLEAQIDILTRFIIAKFGNDPLLQEYLDVLSLADSFSILDIKPKKNLLEEMNHKNKVREEQTSYYARKASN